MSIPQWSTPAGFLGTVTERQFSFFELEALGSTTFSIISGSLPSGLKITTTGTIVGTAFSVGEVIRSTFVVRASGSNGVTDRTFVIDTQGPTEPEWVTPAGYLPLGQGQQSYIINKQFIDYKLNTITDKLPVGQKLRYYIADQEGTLPPGITLTSDGRLVGRVTDVLGLDYQGSKTGGYDEERYDAYPYDHVILNGNIPVRQRVKFLSKIYQFYVTITDGIASSKRLFKIKVEDPSSLRVDTTLIDVDSAMYSADASYLIIPQWLSPANLGIVRANNNQIIQLSTYDPYPNTGPTIYDWSTPKLNQDGSPSVHPRNFSLTTETGALYAALPYQPAYSETYVFTVRLIKTDAESQAVSYQDKTFTLTVRGDVVNTIEFITDENLGMLSPGFQSEISVVAKHTTKDIAIQYSLIDGRLPAGLTLGTDGTINGKIDYNSQTYFDFTLDNGLTTIDSKYYFTVEARDVYQMGAIDKVFYITIIEYDKTKYTKLYVSTLLETSKREMYYSFITDPFIFDRSLIYRINDPEFGIQDKIKLVIEHGIEQIKLNDYIDNMRNYFYKKNFYFGEVKIAKGKDSTGRYLYDLVYVDIIDPVYKIQGPVTVGQTQVFPNSVNNLKSMLETIKIQGTNIKIDEFHMPKFMRTVQNITGTPLGFVLAAPLCYTTPNNGIIVSKRIAASGFDFKLLNFEIDRLIVEDNLSSSGNKYLVFPKQNLQDNNLNSVISTLVGPDGQILYTEDGFPLYSEL